MSIQIDTQIDAASSDAGNWISDGSAASFSTDVVKASEDHLVLVDLWAPWCGPCKQLGPTIEKIVNGLGGAVTLVKIDIDKNPQIAQALRVQSIPAVFAFKGGQPVDAFMGAVPESQIREFIEKNAGDAIAPSPVDEAMNTGIQAFDEDNMEVALAAFAQILDLEPDNIDAKSYLARIYIKLGEAEAAQSLLETINDADAADNANLSKARAALSLAQNATDDDALAPLRVTVEKDPDNLDARFELAKGLIGNEDYDAGGAHLIEIIKRDATWNENAARIELLKMFEVLGQMHDITKHFRRQLSAVLFS